MKKLTTSKNAVKDTDAWRQLSALVSFNFTDMADHKMDEEEVALLANYPMIELVLSINEYRYVKLEWSAISKFSSYINLVDKKKLDNG